MSTEPMPKPAKIPITIYQGDTFFWALRPADSGAGTYTNPDGWTAEFLVVEDGDWSTAPVISLNETAGISLGIGGATLAETTLAAGAAEGATTITVTSATGMRVGDKIDVVLDGYEVKPTRITDIAGTTVTLAEALPVAATSGNAVYVYEASSFGMYTILITIADATTSALTPWGEGEYILRWTDPFGHSQRLAQYTCVLQEGA